MKKTLEKEKLFHSWPKIIPAVVGLILLISTFTFLIAGMLPVKEYKIGERRSCYVTMEDGTRLAVRYTLPAGLKNGEKVAAIMETTRYGTQYKESFVLRALLNLGIAHDVPTAMEQELIKSKYAYIAVDARGSGASFGTREMEWSKEEMNDIGQMIVWIAKQPWSNGKVGTYGISYSGNTAEIAAASDQPALFAAAPLYPDFDVMRQMVKPGGILNDVLVKSWGDSVADMDANKGNLFTAGTAGVDSDKDERLLKEAIAEHHTIDIYKAMKNITYMDDILAGNYTAGSLSPFHYKENIEKSGIPIYSRVGWQDAGTVNGALARFLTYSNPQTLVIGPWSHAGWHYYDPFISKSYSKKELDFKQADEVLSFYNSCLQGENPNKDGYKKAIHYYTLGEGTWKTSNTWPIPGFDQKKWYFDSNGRLSIEKPEETTGKDTYKVDFTTSTGKSNRWFTNCGGGPIFYPDRAKEDKKLLTYTSEPLDNDIEITGVPVVTLNISSTSTDGAFYVYLEDVAPDGKVTYITEGELRALNRKVAETKDIGYQAVGVEHSYLKKDGEQLTPGENTELKIGMYCTSVYLQKGHRIRIAIAGHDAASFERIPGNGDPTIQVQRNRIESSYVELPMRIRK
ncbi:CocE/NonD family hydrolase [Anaerocolumna sedimenticola]|uniref:CocE/NonD family hydrolase n=1 Tax=Anaerocolumna sedimenticola TaxID=2696063 RepID=A0A6P1TUZ1_9FIRM|nr:CocE/NonD family hydrolase [Anaerocolumna sedimenticola]QHQ63298.1 CocE/NonD family hydrolase [Anaerocolumna sedimenticola]